MWILGSGEEVARARMILPPPLYAGQEDPEGRTVVARPSGDQPKGWPTWQAAGLQEGKELYVERCLTCHGCAGNGLGSYAGTLTITPADFKREPFCSMPDDQWFWHVSEGIQGSVMPPWKESLTEEERWQVVGYVQQVYARPVMHDPDEGDPGGDYANLTNPLDNTIEVLDEGKQIFIRECMVCHGDAGRGHGPYRDLLQPGPPDFGDGSYGDYTDSDYFWRISEGVPWSAMPAWKLQYIEEDRWKVVHYIRTMFTQTEDPPSAPPEGEDFTYPDFYKESARFPEDVSYERGKVVFLTTCAHCHGLAGDGQGWDGQYLDIKPANFTDPNMRGMSEGDYYARVSFGIQDSAMPTWGEFLPENERWDAIKFIQESFQTGSINFGSLYSDEIGNNVLTLSSDNWTAEGNVISAENGQSLYQKYCQECHGDMGQGDGPGTTNLPSGGPAAFPKGIPEAYIFWRVWEGIPVTFMPPFNWIISEGDIWDITAYVQQITATLEGGQ